VAELIVGPGLVAVLVTALEVSLANLARPASPAFPNSACYRRHYLAPA